MTQKKAAFTLTEVLITIIIIGIITAFTVPNYVKSVRKADERNVIANLITIRAAVDMYTGYRGAAISNWDSLDLINSNLGLAILDTKSTYACNSAGGFTNGCTATHPIGWAIQFHDEHSSRRLHCSSATACPTCPAQPGECG